MLVNCTFCNKSVFKKPSEISDRNFCGRTCYLNWRHEGGSLQIAIDKGLSVLVNCANCGKEMRKKKNFVERTANICCSRKCQGEYQSKNWIGENNPKYAPEKQLNLTCTECGKPIARRISEMTKSTQAFCNQTCMGNWRSKNQRGENHPSWRGGLQDAVCPECGNVFKEIRANLKTGRRFCSMDCKNRFHSKEMFKDGGARYYGPNWYAQRRAARDRDNHTCQICSRTREDEGRNMPVHHIKRFADFGYDPFQNENYLEANQLSNLVTLCSRCHGRLERGAITYP